MKNKRGLSHIEVILSFVIFIGFLIFILAIFNPFSIPSDNSGKISLVEKEILAYSSLEVKFLSLILNYTPAGCFRFKYENLDNITVKNESYDFINASTDSTGSGKHVIINGAGTKFYYLLSSQDFEERSFSYTPLCRQLDRDNYAFGLFSKHNMTSYTKMLQLAGRHNSDYFALKNDLKISASDDFSFSVLDSLNKLLLNVSKKAPSNIKVVANEVPISLVYKNGTIISAKLNIRVW